MMASLLSIHTCSLGAPILIEEAKNASVTAPAKNIATPNCDRMRTAGEWNVAWDPFYALDPAWTDAVMACGVAVFAGGVFAPKIAEFLSIAFDASITHMYAPGTRRHIKAALAHGATIKPNYGCAQTLRRPGRSGTQHGRADPQRGALPSE